MCWFELWNFMFLTLKRPKCLQKLSIFWCFNMLRKQTDKDKVWDSFISFCLEDWATGISKTHFKTNLNSKKRKKKKISPLEKCIFEMIQYIVTNLYSLYLLDQCFSTFNKWQNPIWRNIPNRAFFCFFREANKEVAEPELKNTVLKLLFV